MYGSILALRYRCQIITKSFERKIIVLKAEVFSNSRHSRENTVVKLGTVLSSSEIQKEKAFCIVIVVIEAENQL